MKFLTNLDLSQNEIQNAVIQPLAAAPANPKLGQIYYNSSDSLLYQYDGAQWKPVGKGYELPAATKTALGGIKERPERLERDRLDERRLHQEQARDPFAGV